MNIFFDTEFTGLHQHTTLISFGAINESGEESFYHELNDYDKSQVDAWQQENIFPNLLPHQKPVPREKLKFDLEDWLKDFGEEIIIWGDCLAYDWVLFCELWGGALNVPSWINYIPRDLCTLFEIHGIDPDVDRRKFVGHFESRRQHNALFDAVIIRQCYLKIKQEADIPDLRETWLRA